MGKLTALMVKSVRCPPELKRPARFGDGDGLYLQVAPGNSKSWLFRYALRGKSREMGLGPVGDPPGAVPLAEARKLAGAARAVLRDGRDPIVDRQERRETRRRAEIEATERTFRSVAEALVQTKTAGWKSHKHAGQWTATFNAHVFPVIGDMPVAAVATDDVLRALRPIWETTPETASRVRQRIEAVLDAARVKGWRTGDNPARWRGHLAGEPPPPRKVKRVAHRPALPWERMSAFTTALAERDGIAALALRFAIMTAARTGEVRGARWLEIDLEAKLWVVPGDRMKAGRSHRVPLSSTALAILETVRPLMKGLDDLVFPSSRKSVALSDMALSEVVRRMNEGGHEGALPLWRDAEGRPIVPHGFRSSFRDWAGETRNDGHDVIEASLAHTIKNKAQAAYARSDLLERRRPLMQAWAEHCSRPASGVVEMAERRAHVG